MALGPTPAWNSLELTSTFDATDFVLVTRTSGKQVRVSATDIGGGAALAQQVANLQTSVGHALAQNQQATADAQSSVDNLTTSVGLTLGQAQTTIADNKATYDSFVTLQTATNLSVATSITTLTAAVGAGGVSVFFQSTTPTSTHAGDLWIDSGNNNKIKRWNGTAWDDVNNTDIAAAIAAISAESTTRATADTALASSITSLTSVVSGNTAAITSEATTRASADSAISSTVTTLTATVNGKNSTYLQSTTPSSPVTGDLWIDTGHSNSIKRWSGSAWVAADNTDIATNTAAISTESSARISADSALSTSITSVAAIANGGTASGFYQLTAASSPADGATAQFDVQVKATSGGTFANAGMTIQAFSTGVKRIKFTANQFIVTDGTTNSIPFAIVGTDLLASALKVPNANVNGLGALALKNTAAAGTDVTGLGLMAFIAKLTAGNLATYMDTAIISNAYISDLSASKITSGSITTASLIVTDGSGNYILRADVGGSGTTLYKPLCTSANFGNLGGGNAIYAQANSYEAVYGYGTGGGSGHGVRGITSSGTSGIVGAAGGGYDFYADGSGTNYGPFTGAHDALIDPAESVDLGDIVVDAECIVRGGISNTLFRVTKSAAPNQAACVGVVAVKHGVLSTQMVPAVFKNTATVTTDEDTRGVVTYAMPPDMQAIYDSVKDAYNYILINALGEGQINVCGEGGDLSAGDLIVASSTPGKGMKQSDNIVRSNTVAKVREAVTFASPSEVKLVACIYLCG